MDARLIEMVRDEADSPLWGELEISPETDLCVDWRSSIVHQRLFESERIVS